VPARRPCTPNRLRIGEATGRAALALARSGWTPADIVTPASVRNALRVLLAIGGSTNALIHLTAIAGRLGIPVDAGELNEISDRTPTLVALKPTGEFYMEDFHAAGGCPRCCTSCGTHWSRRADG